MASSLADAFEKDGDMGVVVVEGEFGRLSDGDLQGG